MTENKRTKEELLNPNFGLSTDKPDIKGFLTWLYDPEVTEAYKQLEEEEQAE